MESPGYTTGSPYPDSLDCSWTITNTAAAPVRVWFDTPFNLETGYTHCYDTLVVEGREFCGDKVGKNLMEINPCNKRSAGKNILFMPHENFSCGTLNFY